MTEPEPNPCQCPGANCKLSTDSTRHGTPNGYGNNKCRCWDCTAAWAEYSVSRRHDRRSRGLPPGDPRHGTDNGYTNYACRCEPCVQARAEARKTAA